MYVVLRISIQLYDPSINYDEEEVEQMYKDISEAKLEKNTF